MKHYTVIVKLHPTWGVVCRSFDDFFDVAAFIKKSIESGNEIESVKYVDKPPIKPVESWGQK